MSLPNTSLPYPFQYPGQPTIKIIALSNIFCRLMHFAKKGDIEKGHKHTYDHATLVSSGSVRVEMLDDESNVLSSKDFKAPTMVYIKKDTRHRLTALEDDTVCGCIHAIKTMDDEIVDPEFLIEPVVSKNRGDIRDLVAKATDKEMVPLVYKKNEGNPLDVK